MKGLKIAAIEEAGTAWEIGIEPGDEILSINGQEAPDDLCYRYLIASEDVTLLVRKAGGGLVEIELEKDEDDDLGVTFKDGSRLECGTLVWAAGVRASPLADTLGMAACRGGRVCVGPTLQVPDHPEVYAIGDAKSLGEFQRHLAEGPRSAYVTGIEESDEPVRKEFSTFRIEGGW